MYETTCMWQFLHSPEMAVAARYWRAAAAGHQRTLLGDLLISVIGAVGGPALHHPGKLIFPHTR